MVDRRECEVSGWSKCAMCDTNSSQERRIDREVERRIPRNGPSMRECMCAEVRVRDGRMPRRVAAERAIDDVRWTCASCQPRNGGYWQKYERKIATVSVSLSNIQYEDGTDERCASVTP